MVTDAPAAPRKLVVPIAALHGEVAKSFLFGLAGRFDAPVEVALGGRQIVLPLFDAHGGGDSALISSLAIADGVVVLLRHLDPESVARLQSTLKSLPPAAEMPRVFVIGRAEVDRDYKAGCPACGQKVMLKDADAGKSAKCPRCEYRFRIHAPDELLRLLLKLPADVPVALAVLGQQESCRAPLLPLLASLRPRAADDRPLLPVDPHGEARRLPLPQIVAP